METLAPVQRADSTHRERAHHASISARYIMTARVSEHNGDSKLVQIFHALSRTGTCTHHSLWCALIALVESQLVVRPVTTSCGAAPLMKQPNSALASAFPRVRPPSHVPFLCPFHEHKQLTATPLIAATLDYLLGAGYIARICTNRGKVVCDDDGLEAKQKKRSELNTLS